jgi:outer membrane protein assembly factor BamB
VRYGKGRRIFASKRVRLASGALVVLVAAAAVGGYLYQRKRTGSIYHPHAPFTPQPTPQPKKEPVFSWPLYGYTPNHTRFFPARGTLHPPYIQVWAHGFHSLLEFPPVIYDETIFQLADDAVLAASSRYTGRTLWSRHLGELSASAPAVNATTVYATVLSGHGGAPGRVYALDTANGHTRWSRDLPARCESSPLLVGGRLYFGTENGTVYALDSRTGRVTWTYHAEGAVKASPSLSGGILYFGDYSGHVQAVSAASGRRIWISGSEGTLFGSGTFYSTSAVMYGRVFLGNTDGRIYAYDAHNGKLDWAVQTGAYVYASPAVTNAPGIGPTIYLGSYDGTFYALNARTGHISWRFGTHGRISGSATIIGDIVYFADLGEKRTYGLGISTGRVLFSKNTGSFDPAISDGEHVFLTGTTGLYSLKPG